MPAQDPFCVFLNRKFQEKKERNDAFSLRAYAKFLEVDQSTLTKVMKGQRQFAPETRERLIEKLATNEAEARDLQNDIEKRQGNFVAIEDEVTEMIASWHYWGILELLKLPDFNHTLEDISDRLGIRPDVAQSAVVSLESLGFLKLENSKFVLLTPSSSWATTEKTTAARKELQRSFLQKSQEALEVIPFEQRDHSSITIAIDVKRMSEFKEKLTDMRREFGRFAQKTGTLDEVYTLTMSLFPISKKKK